MSVWVWYAAWISGREDFAILWRSILGYQVAWSTKMSTWRNRFFLEGKWFDLVVCCFGFDAEMLFCCWYLPKVQTVLRLYFWIFWFPKYGGTSFWQPNMSNLGLLQILAGSSPTSLQPVLSTSAGGWPGEGAKERCPVLSQMVEELSRWLRLISVDMSPKHF